MTDKLVAAVCVIAALGAAGFGYRLHNRYRAAIEYSGIGRPYPIGNSLLAFAGLAMMLLGVIIAGVIAMVFWTR